MSDRNKPTIALLIDAENVAYHYMDMVMNHLKDMGDLIIKRAYANWAKTNLQNWQTVIVHHGITAIQQFEHISGKNACDITISIDAIELLYSKNIDIFCLVSSDSDFTPLCLRLREHGKKVIGMGGMNCSKALVNACSEFKFFFKEEQLPEIIKPPIRQNAYKYKEKNDPNSNKTLINLVTKLIDESGSNGEVNISVIGTAIRNNPKIDLHYYDCCKVSELIQRLDDFETRLHGQSTLMVRKRHSHSNPPKTTPKTIIEPQKIAMLDKQSSEILLKNTGLINSISNAIALYQNQSWANIDKVSDYIRDTFGIESQHYGYENMVELLKNLTTFDVKKENNIYYVKDARWDYDDDINPSQNPKNRTKITKTTKSELQKDKYLIDTISEIIAQYQESDGWSQLSYIGTGLKEKELSAKHYGYKNLRELMQALDIFDIKVEGSVTFIKNPFAKPKKTPSQKPLDTQPSQQSDEPTKPNPNNLEQSNLDHNQPEDNHLDQLLEMTSTTTKQTDEIAQNTVENPKFDNIQEPSTEEQLIIDELDFELINAFSQVENNDMVADIDDSLLLAMNDAILATKNKNGWASVGDIGKHIRYHAGISSKDYGYSTFGKLIQDIEGIETKQEGRKLFVRLDVMNTGS